ncbi:hypothetical protein [Inhella proteolytica]|uniref:Cytochrome c domain-containing protein n=1 Tax=Inhella proteolytica TaxID=2795029 RepID=A0A931J6Z8_9BURK|nr:hypothetical protein [Inhella proteolytica]MBH9577275.1 hypothetical protein [Inhella proteolytica]
MKTGLLMLVALAALGPGQAPAPQFDPLFDPGSARCGPPPQALRLAALGKPETSPFPPQPGQAAPGPVPLYRNLGTLSVPLGRGRPQAQAYFDQGLRLAFAFNHAEAQRAFQAAQRLDPGCALCHWGEAWVLGPNINAPMAPEAQTPALAALGRAAALKTGLPPLQRGLIEALEKRYSADPAAERASLDAAFADALQALAAQHPREDLLQVLAAEAAMNTQAWDYWQVGGAEPKGRAAAIVQALETVLKRSPSHPGAIHLYIHAVEASNRPERALKPARRLAALMPGAGHMVHMPAHIYYRVGLYRDALRANQQAIAADEAYFKTSPSDAMYRSAYYPHNIHFLMVAAQLGGDGPSALQAAAKLDAALPLDTVRAVAALQPLKAAPFGVHALFSRPETVLALPAPPPELVLLQAMHRHARTLALARLGRLDEAQQEVEALARLEREADFKPFEAWGVPALAVVQTARWVSAARLAEARGELDAAALAYEAAIAIEDGLAYMEPPYWYYPVRQSLGALRLRQGRLDEAEAALREALARVRNNGWALAGLQAVYERKGDAASARSTRAALQRAWFGPARGPEPGRI